MFTRFFPEFYFASVYDVDYDALYDAGIRGLAFDLDNTLEPYDVAEPGETVVALINVLQARFAVCLVSNNVAKRVSKYNAALGLPAIHRAGKPGKKAARRVLAALGLPAAQTALIGDQIFTDVWCANRSGLTGVLVEPVSRRDEWYVQWKRAPERFILGKYFKHKAGEL